MSGIDSANDRRWFRSKPRGLVSTDGRIFIHGDTTPLDCKVIDLSAGGARLALGVMQDLPRKFEFLHGGVRKACVLAWQRGHLVGIAFEVKAEQARTGISSHISWRVAARTSVRFG